MVGSASRLERQSARIWREGAPAAGREGEGRTAWRRSGIGEHHEQPTRARPISVVEHGAASGVGTSSCNQAWKS
eukprot:scaffold5422_cov36-Tisochrysis_lutea.AAC.4